MRAHAQPGRESMSVKEGTAPPRYTDRSNDFAGCRSSDRPPARSAPVHAHPTARHVRPNGADRPRRCDHGRRFLGLPTTPRPNRSTIRPAGSITSSPPASAVEDSLAFQRSSPSELATIRPGGSPPLRPVLRRSKILGLPTTLRLPRATTFDRTVWVHVLGAPAARWARGPRPDLRRSKEKVSFSFERCRF